MSADILAITQSALDLTSNTPPPRSYDCLSVLTQSELNRFYCVSSSGELLAELLAATFDARYFGAVMDVVWLRMMNCRKK